MEIFFLAAGCVAGLSSWMAYKIFMLKRADQPASAIDGTLVPLQEILVFKGFYTDEELQNTARLAHQAFPGVLTIFLGPGRSLETLGEVEMRAYGWVRAAPADLTGEREKAVSELSDIASRVK